MQVDTILRSKGMGVETIGPDEPVRIAAHRMSSQRIGCLVVTRDGVHVEGLVTERDLVRALARRGAEASTCRVRDVMSTDVPTCTPNENITSLMHTMTERRYRHVPVVSSTAIVGLVSIGDIVKHRLQDLELEASVLRDVNLSAR